MSNGLKKTVSPSAKSKLPVKAQAPVPSVLGSLQKMELTKGLPPATIIYGMSAGAFFALGFYLLAERRWLESLLTMFPAACFVGFAVHLLKHSQPRS